MVGRGAESGVGGWLDGSCGDYGREEAREDSVEAVEEEDGVEEDGGEEVIGC